MQIDPKLRIMISGRAPCPDYSKITEGPGREGDQGQLFGLMCDLLRDLLPRLQGRSAGVLVENVFMNAYGDISYFNGCLSGHFGLVSRPRLWWTRVDWSKCTGYKWSLSGRIHRLHVQTERDDLAQLDMRGYSFGKEVRAGLQLLPCFTTPAPTESGGSAPKKMKTQSDSATRQRWLDDSRTFVPWHYQQAAMVSSPQGRLEVLPPFLTEQARHLPVDFSKHDLCTDRDRRRLLGNSWHKGVASFLFKIVLEHGVFVVEDPGAQPSDPSQCSSVRETFAWVRGLQFPITTLEVTLDIVSRTQALALASHRDRILTHVERLVASLRQETDDWYQSVPQHVARTLWPQGQPRSEVLAFLRLLSECGYSDVGSLEEDFRTGFPLLGELKHTPGWRPRLDDTYAHPISIDSFRQLNSEYIQQRLQHSRLDPNWEHMLQEVLQEVSDRHNRGSVCGAGPLAQTDGGSGVPRDAPRPTARRGMPGCTSFQCVPDWSRSEAED